MTSVLARLDDGTIQLNVPLPWADVEKARNQIVDEAVAQAEMAGFRKGKAPREMVEKSLDEMKIRDEVLKKLLPSAYMMAVQEHKLKPIMNPKIQIEKIDEGKDWSFVALTVEMPEVNVSSYKEAVQKITAKSKIVVPGKENTEPPFDEIMKAVLDNTTVKIPELLIEQEVDRLLSHTLDEIKRLGLSLDQYLASTGKTAEALRDEYRLKAENDIKMEFVLQTIADTEKISVEEAEIAEALSKAKDPAERENLESNKYLLASIIRQQKTLDYLKQL